MLALESPWILEVLGGDSCKTLRTICGAQINSKGDMKWSKYETNWTMNYDINLGLS